MSSNNVKLELTLHCDPQLMASIKALAAVLARCFAGGLTEAIPESAQSAAVGDAETKIPEPAQTYTKNHNPGTDYSAETSHTAKKQDTQHTIAAGTESPMRTIEQLRALGSAKDRSKVKALLKEYGVDRLTDLDKKLYNEFYSKLEAV